MRCMPSSSDSAGADRVLVVTPTYNEIESLATTIAAVRACTPEADILIVDDSSPDGTGELAERLAAADPQLHVIHRLTKDGLGRAYLAGFAWAAERNYGIVVEMDADGSHPADSLPAMLTALRADDGLGLVIGSRWIPGGSVVDWPLGRRILSTGANRYARIALGIPVYDITAGYRAYRRAVLDGLNAETVDSRGYCFQIDLTIRTFDAGWGIREVPIIFRERVAGVSKMSSGIVVEAMRKVTWWGLKRRLSRSGTRSHSASAAS
jgi:dolichol-phosphate mannosyltransferase